ncbi:MAG: hypothetical protein ACRD1Y_05000 [Terriglobales bacterium]
MWRTIALLCLTLAVFAAAARPQSVRSPHGPWIAQRVDASHVMACMEMVNPALPLPPGLNIKQNESHGICNTGTATPAQMRLLQALDPGGEHFSLGESYRLLVAQGPPMVVRVSSLIVTLGAPGDSADPGLDTYLGTLLEIAPSDRPRFARLRSKYYALERMDAPWTPAALTGHFMAWRPAPPPLAAALLALAQSKLAASSFSNLTLQPGSAIDVANVFVTRRIPPAACLLRVVWPSPRGNGPGPSFYAWVALAPTPRVVGPVDMAVGEGGERLPNGGARILNLVPLDAAHVAILSDDIEMYHYTYQLWVLGRDGSLRLANAFGATSD